MQFIESQQKWIVNSANMNIITNKSLGFMGSLDPQQQKPRQQAFLLLQCDKRKIWNGVQI